MKRLLILLAILSLLAPACLAETIIIGMGETPLDLNEPCRMEGAHVLTLLEMNVEPCETQGKQRLSIQCYFKNLSHDTVEFADVTAMTLVFDGLFELPMPFDHYTHVRTSRTVPAPCPAEPLVEIIGCWVAEVPDIVANAGEGQLSLEFSVNGTDYTAQLR